MEELREVLWAEWNSYTRPWRLTHPLQPSPASPAALLLICTEKPFTMQIAAILSDLTSLRVCDHSAALALVSTRAPASDPLTTESLKPDLAANDHRRGSDLDMERAMDLMALHHGVKMKHVQGENRELVQARKDVDAVLAKLSKFDERA
ncbi:MAG: hypothetical protein Q9216_000587 [Gyalolechia sp. 2 TL-2023]